MLSRLKNWLYEQEEDCVIEALSLVDCKLKSELYSLINAVGSNQSLQHLDLKYFSILILIYLFIFNYFSG